jgi:hypothetical protein
MATTEAPAEKSWFVLLASLCADNPPTAAPHNPFRKRCSDREKSPQMSPVWIAPRAAASSSSTMELGRCSKSTPQSAQKRPTTGTPQFQQ